MYGLWLFPLAAALEEDAVDGVAGRLWGWVLLFCGLLAEPGVVFSGSSYSVLVVVFVAC